MVTASANICRVLLALLWLEAAAGMAQESLGPYDYQVKAVYLFKFTRYIEWPNRPDRVDGSMMLCLLEGNPFGPAIDAATRAWNGPWSIEVRQLQRGDDYSDCQLMFIPEGQDEFRSDRLVQNTESPILMVGESPQFLQRGGMIRFVTEGNTVSFEVNLEAAEEAGLKISSRLLQVARVVGRKQ